MKRIKPDHQRRLEIPGVPDPVQRPVDIDRSQTGFAILRSLRIYRFEANSVINGHAEEDEVLIVVLAGAIQLTLIDGDSKSSSHTLLAAGEAPGHPCAAYLPPHAAYRLVPQTGADVAYARATPASGPLPAVFRSQAGPDHGGIALLLEEAKYPRLLRVRLLQIRAEPHEITFMPIAEEEDACEAWIHITTVPEEGIATIMPAGGVPASLTSWDTVSVAPRDRPTLRIAKGSSALVLTVLAG